MKKLQELRNKAMANVLDNGSSNNLSLEVSTKLVELVIEGCEKAAAQHAQSYADVESMTGATGAARAVRAYGDSLLKE